MNTLRWLGKGFAEFALIAPTRRIGGLRKIVEYVERRSRILPPHAALPGHRNYIWLPGHEGEYAARYYAAMRDLFVGAKGVPPPDSERRRAIIDRFERIDAEVEIKSSPVEGLYLAEAALSVASEGDLVECGCYTGGSTAKLSIVAALTGRRLVAFDSFEGLPTPQPGESVDPHVRRGARSDHVWTAGEYAGALGVVRANVEKYGEIACTTFVKGWFSDTLEGGLPSTVALAFVDVDLASSAAECLQRIWPRMTWGGVFFTHDAAYIKVLQALTDRALWQNVLHDHPPIFFGAGFGMGDAAAHLGFAVKGNVEAKYIKALTLSK
jgi:O-methyltransferase